MTAEAALRGCRSIFLDAAPTIYYLSADSPFNRSTVRAIAHCFRASVRIVASPVTLAESLADEADPFKQRITRNLPTTHIVMINIEVGVAEEVARLRRTTRLKLPTVFNSLPPGLPNATRSSLTTPNWRRRPSPCGSSWSAISNPDPARAVCLSMPMEDLMKLREVATDRTLTAVSATSVPETTGDSAVDQDFTLDFVDEYGTSVEVRASDIGGPDALYQVI